MKRGLGFLRNMKGGLGSRPPLSWSGVVGVGLLFKLDESVGLALMELERSRGLGPSFPS